MKMLAVLIAAFLTGCAYTLPLTPQQELAAVNDQAWSEFEARQSTNPPHEALKDALCRNEFALVHPEMLAAYVFADMSAEYRHCMAETK
jgi:hypothetical protein